MEQLLHLALYVDQIYGLNNQLFKPKVCLIEPVSNFASKPALADVFCSVNQHGKYRYRIALCILQNHACAK